jgi:hypothetical protein
MTLLAGSLSFSIAFLGVGGEIVAFIAEGWQMADGGTTVGLWRQCTDGRCASRELC